VSASGGRSALVSFDNLFALVTVGVRKVYRSLDAMDAVCSGFSSL
jgi:hypothetical protein